MRDHLDFGVWAPSEAAFWDTWIARGICTAPGVYAPAYAGMIDTTADWSGIVVASPPIDGPDGNVLTPAVLVPGWHTNVRVSGPILAAFTAGRPATGTIWERTNAAAVFGLTPQAADPATGFPAGMRTASGITYADPSAFSSPSNIWA